MAPKPDIARFWAKVEMTPTCWLWRGALRNKALPYGVVRYAGKQHAAHRFAYEQLIGPIPDGLTLDHLCRVGRCVNPAHLEPVTLKENWRRAPNHPFNRTHCPQGHPYDRINGGKRVCRKCRNAQQRAYLQRRAGELDHDDG